MESKNYLKWDLAFVSKEVEESYILSKSQFQRPALNVLIVSGVIILVGSWIINPYNLPNYEGVMLYYQIGIILFAILSYFIARKKPNLSENLIVLLISVYIFGFLESTQKNRNYWGITVFYLAGSLIELNLMSSIVAKVRWKKIAVISMFTSCLACFRSLPFADNYNSKFYPLILFIEQNFIHFGFGYCFEWFDRKAFFEMKNYEFSLKCFKDMIIEVIPNSIIITDGEEIMFQNKESLDIFQSPDNSQLLEKLKCVFLENRDEDRMQNFDKNKHIETMGFFEFQSLEESQSIFSYLQSNKKELQKVRNIHRIIHVFYNTDRDNRKCFEVHLKNIFWEKKHAIMLLITENLMINKVKHLNELSLYKDRLLATVSHDLRTPLNGIMGMLAISLELELEIQIRKNLTVALRSSYLLLSMINDILDFSQISNGKLRLNFALFSVREVIKDVSKLIKFQAKQKGLKFSRDCSLVRDFQIRSDQNRLRQILLNLLGNALKFTERGFITISAEPLIVNKKKTAGVILKIEDSGKGIKEEDQSRLFKLFGKVENQESKNINPHGVGLGLAISQSLVKILNNNIEGYEIKVQSMYGRGSCFWFELLDQNTKYEEENVSIMDDIDGEVHEEIPVFETTNKSVTYLELMEKPSYEKGARILLVDDDQINLMVGSKFLKSDSTIEFEIAHDGLDAIEKIKKKSLEQEFFDVILMDCNMPNMDGFEASQIIRNMIKSNLIPDLKIIACTANAAESDYKKSLQSGMNDHITKPFTKTELFAKIQKNLARKNKKNSFMQKTNLFK